MLDRHGLRATYQQGCRCLPCASANAHYQQAYRQLKAQGRQPLGALVSAVEAHRRIRSLLAERYTRGQIARQLGLRRQRLEVHPSRVRLRTVLKLRRLARLCLGEGDIGGRNQN